MRKFRIHAALDDSLFLVLIVVTLLGAAAMEVAALGGAMDRAPAELPVATESAAAATRTAYAASYAGGLLAADGVQPRAPRP